MMTHFRGFLSLRRECEDCRQGERRARISRYGEQHLPEVAHCGLHTHTHAPTEDQASSWRGQRVILNPGNSLTSS